MMLPPDRARGAVWRRPVIVLTSALVVATVLVLLLSLHVRQLREDQRWLVDRATTPYVGMYVPRVSLNALDGTHRLLGQPRAQHQVVFFFTTTCPHCLSSLPMVRSIANQLDTVSGGSAEMLGVAYAATPVAAAYARKHALPFPVIASEDRRTSMLFRARKVPLLLVIGRDGRIRYSRIGVLNSKEGVNGVLSAVRNTD